MAALHWLALVCMFSSVSSCLQCEPEVRNMLEDFLGTVKGLTVRDRMTMKKNINHAYFTYQETSRHLRGIIDATTLYRAQTEYQNEFERHWNQDLPGTVQIKMIQVLEKGKNILQKHLEIFVREGLCPNKCGLLFQSVINCSSCQYGLYTCLSATPPLDCGDHQLVAKEGAGVVLDCFLPWHSLVLGQPEYHYSWKQGARNFSSEEAFQILVVTKESKIALNQLDVSEQGVYRCLVQDNEGIELTRMHFTLKVTPLPAKPPRPVPTLPSQVITAVSDFSLNNLYSKNTIICLAVLTAVCITACLVVITCWCGQGQQAGDQRASHQSLGADTGEQQSPPSQSSGETGGQGQQAGDLRASHQSLGAGTGEQQSPPSQSSGETGQEQQAGDSGASPQSMGADREDPQNPPGDIPGPSSEGRRKQLQAGERRAHSLGALTEEHWSPPSQPSGETGRAEKQKETEELLSTARKPS